MRMKSMEEGMFDHACELETLGIRFAFGEMVQIEWWSVQDVIDRYEAEKDDIKGMRESFQDLMEALGKDYVPAYDPNDNLRDARRAGWAAGELQTLLMTNMPFEQKKGIAVALKDFQSDAFRELVYFVYNMGGPSAEVRECLKYYCR
jgi:hypothetical protein